MGERRVLGAIVAMALLLTLGGWFVLQLEPGASDAGGASAIGEGVARDDANEPVERAPATAPTDRGGDPGREAAAPDASPEAMRVDETPPPEVEEAARRSGEVPLVGTVVVLGDRDDEETPLARGNFTLHLDRPDVPAGRAKIQAYLLSGGATVDPGRDRGGEPRVIDVVNGRFASTLPRECRLRVETIEGAGPLAIATIEQKEAKSLYALHLVAYRPATAWVDVLDAESGRSLHDVTAFDRPADPALDDRLPPRLVARSSSPVLVAAPRGVSKRVAELASGATGTDRDGRVAPLASFHFTAEGGYSTSLAEVDFTTGRRNVVALERGGGLVVRFDPEAESDGERVASARLDLLRIADDVSDALVAAAARGEPQAIAALGALDRDDRFVDAAAFANGRFDAGTLATGRWLVALTAATFAERGERERSTSRPAPPRRSAPIVAAGVAQVLARREMECVLVRCQPSAEPPRTTWRCEFHVPASLPLSIGAVLLEPAGGRRFDDVPIEVASPDGRIDDVVSAQREPDRAGVLSASFANLPIGRLPLRFTLHVTGRQLAFEREVEVVADAPEPTTIEVPEPAFVTVAATRRDGRTDGLKELSVRLSPLGTRSGDAWLSPDRGAVLVPGDYDVEVSDETFELVSPRRVTLAAGPQELYVVVEPATRLEIDLTCEGAPLRIRSAALDRARAIELPEARVAEARGELRWRLVHGGKVRIELPPLPGFEPAAPVTVDAAASTTTRATIDLVRRR